MANTKSDNRHQAFIALGLTTGSLPDRSMVHLTNKGATTGSLADRQRQLGKVPDPAGHIDPTLYP
jgi:hypothetical protein